MTYDRREFLDTVAARAKERTAAVMPLLRAAVAVAPIMENLQTGTDWDRYLQYLQSYIEQATRAKETALAKISGPEAADPLVLAKLRVDIITADAMIDAWAVAMNLPKALIEGGAEAYKQIARFEVKDDDTAGQPQS